MASILVWDGYGKDLHMALRGVVENVRERRWKAGRYALARRWFGGEEEESVWKEVVRVVAERKEMLENENEVNKWEEIVLGTMTLAGASGYLETWWGGEDVLRTSLLHVASSVGSERLVDWVLERGGEVEVKNSRIATPVLVACQYGHLGVVKQLVGGGAEVNVRDRRSRSALFVACKNGHLDVVTYLMGTGRVEVDGQGRGGWTPLGVAARYGHVDVVRVLVEEGGANVDVEGRMRKSPLGLACEYGWGNVVRVLVEMGAWSGVGGGEGVWERGLMAAVKKGYVDVVSVLVGAGVGEVDAALVVASRMGREDVVRVLVEGGGVEGGERGETALIAACREGCVGVVELLLEAGVGVGVGEDGVGAVEVARREGRGRVLEVLNRYRPPGA